MRGRGRKAGVIQFPGLIRAPNSGVGGGQEGTDAAEGHSDLRISPAEFPVAGQGPGVQGGDRKIIKQMKNSVPTRFRGHWGVAGDLRGVRAGGLLSTSLAWLAADRMCASAGDYCLLSTYYGLDAGILLPRDSPDPPGCQTPCRRSLLLSADEKAEARGVHLPQFSRPEGGKNGG